VFRTGVRLPRIELSSYTTVVPVGVTVYWIAQVKRDSFCSIVRRRPFAVSVIHTYTMHVQSTTDVPMSNMITEQRVTRFSRVPNRRRAETSKVRVGLLLHAAGSGEGMTTACTARVPRQRKRNRARVCDPCVRRFPC